MPESELLALCILQSLLGKQQTRDTGHADKTLVSRHLELDWPGLLFGASLEYFITLGEFLRAQFGGPLAAYSPESPSFRVFSPLMP
jgi:hypothetical protein